MLTFTTSNAAFFINVEINADSFAEREEDFFLEAVSTNPFITVSPNKTTINIIDDDCESFTFCPCTHGVN